MCLQERASLDGDLSLLGAEHASDGTCKLTFACAGGKSEASVVETVLIPMRSGPKRRARMTVCVSSQGALLLLSTGNSAPQPLATATCMSHLK
jgi:adenine C2-methylase RlmN of 23S rRNA A2503 and tRNA A37